MLVTSISTDRLNPGRRVVKVDRRRVVTLHLDGIEALGLKEGTAWTPALRERAAARVVYEKARTAAVRWTSARAISRASLETRLGRYQLSAADRTALVDELQARGLVDDAALADALVESKLTRGPVALDGLIAAVRGRGVGEAEARAAASDALRGRDPGTDARELAATRLRSLPPGLDVQTIRRRLFAHLARRGFDEETATEAVDRVLKG